MRSHKRVLLSAIAIGGVTAALAGLPVASPPVASSHRMVQVASTVAVPAAPTRLVIHTDGGVPVTSLDNYVTGSMTLLGQRYPLQIKGRGHSTWLWPKKPYKLKLDTAASLFGMPAERDWTLLANYADRSSLRNYLALWFASQTRLAWTARTHFVDVTLNHKELGTYLMTEQVEQSAQRVSLPADGMLLEIDKRFRVNGDPGFYSSHRIPIAYKDPDTPTWSQKVQLKSYVNAFESALYSAHFRNPTTGYRAYVNLPSFVDWYIVNEVFKNVDADFYSSDNFTWVPGQKLTMGPVWDFDRSGGFNAPVGVNLKDPIGWWVRAGEVAEPTHPLHSVHWLARMCDDPAFRAMVRNRWAVLRPTFDAMVNSIPKAAAALDGSVLADWAEWHDANAPTQVAAGVHAATYNGEVSFLQNWLRQRATWMSSHATRWRTASRTVSEGLGGIRRLRVSIGGGATVPASVHIAVTGGTAIRGVDYVLDTPNLTLTGGHTTRVVRLTIVNDSLREGPETIRLTLTNPSPGSRIGFPSVVVVTIAAND